MSIRQLDRAELRQSPCSKHDGSPDDALRPNSAMDPTTSSPSDPHNRGTDTPMHQQAPEVALDEELVLLGVAAGDDQVVLAAHEPVEALEPVRLAHLLHHRRPLLDLHAAYDRRNVSI